jgi:hypothetical protein
MTFNGMYDYLPILIMFTLAPALFAFIEDFTLMLEGVLNTGMYTTSSIITGATFLFVMGLKHLPLTLMTILLADDTFLVYLTL